ncbi:MAG: (deoxy)nucleoside triphosphate pyrophosphohydrolase [Clostridia bacterium]|nr:(deoxy)nucleoside triphosphate pyrophosphohydrolase [Clostridia bacterium]
MKNRIRVVAALISKGNKIFAAKRAYGFLKGKWELPGGKIEPGETPEQAIKREIKEELSTDISVNGFVSNIVHEYPDFILDMDVFDCSVIGGRLSLDKGVHLEEAFLDSNEIKLEEWCPADGKLLEELKNR